MLEHPIHRFVFPPEEVINSVPEEDKEQVLRDTKMKQILHHMDELGIELAICRRTSPGRMDDVAQEYMKHVQDVVERQGVIINLCMEIVPPMYVALKA